MQIIAVQCSKYRYHRVLPAISPATSRDHKDHDRNKEQDAGDISGCSGNAAKAKYRRHDRNNKEEQGQPQHGEFSTFSD